MKTAIHPAAFAAILLLATASAQGGAGDIDPDGRQPTYKVIELPSLGGTGSSGNAINDRGWVAGYSQLPGDRPRRAVLWRDGDIIDLGSLGDEMTNSNVPWPGINNRGMVVGISQTDDDDPNDEEWSCSAFLPAGSNTGPACVGAAWHEDRMFRLPTLGGTHGFATGVNNRGQMVGWAENTVVDETCVAPQRLQFRATLWEFGKGRKDGISVAELPPLEGDTSSAATAINERGQVVGISGTCDQAVGRYTARNAVIWNRGKPEKIDDLGGATWHTPMDINERGHVVGFSNLETDEGDDEAGFNAHAFLWTGPGKIIDLGTLGDDLFSQAQGINARGQVVGISFGGSSGSRAFLWDGELLNLNELAPGYTGTLLNAKHINNRGEITGSALSSSGEIVAFIAKPVRKR